MCTYIQSTFTDKSFLLLWWLWCSFTSLWLLWAFIAGALRRFSIADTVEQSLADFLHISPAMDRKKVLKSCLDFWPNQKIKMWNMNFIIIFQGMKLTGYCNSWHYMDISCGHSGWNVQWYQSFTWGRATMSDNKACLQTHSHKFNNR